MNSILLFDYFATGEGATTVIKFTNDTRVTDEMALNELKSEYNEYFHCGFELINICDAKNNTDLLHLLQSNVPVLYRYITGDLVSPLKINPLLNISYTLYINYN